MLLDSTVRREAPALTRGAAIGRYLALEHLGAGAMGVVWSAYDPDLDRKVAIKVLHPATEEEQTLAQARLLREAQAMARLSHPHVVSVFDVGRLSQSIFLAMELVEGSTLRARLERRPGFAETLRLFMEAGRGLAAAHEAGIVHRDFKPENVLVDAAGRARVADFGLAHTDEAWRRDLPPDSMAPGVMTMPGALLGTPAYMAPEQWRSVATDARADQFSWCVALYEALVGHRPFQGNTIAELRDSVTRGALEAAPPAELLPDAVLRVLHRGLQSDPAARWPSMDALLQALAQVTTPRAPQPWTRTRRAVVFGALAVGTAVIAAAVVASDRAVRCASAGAPVDAVWTTAVRDGVLASLRATARPWSAAVADRTAQHLDAYATQLKAMRTDACEATRLRGEQSDEALTLRIRCLDRRQGDLAALTRELSQATPAVAERAVNATLALAPVDLCADLEALALPTRPPTPEAFAAVAALAPAVARAEALRLSGQFEAAGAAATEVLPAVQRTGWDPLEAEVLAILGRSQDEAGNGEAAGETLQRAVLAAERGHDDARRAQVLVDLAYVSRARSTQARGFLSQAEAVLGRLGGDRARELGRLRSIQAFVLSVAQDDADAAMAAEAVRLLRSVGATADLISALNNQGVALARGGHADEALAAYEEALRLARRAWGDTAPALAPMLANRGGAEVLAGRAEDGVRELRAACNFIDEAFGSEHPMSWRCANNLAWGLLRLGYPAEARAPGQRALDAWRASGRPNLATYVLTLGAIEFALGNLEASQRLFDEALPLAAGHAPHLSEVHLGLAQLRLARGDGAGALALLGLGDNVTAKQAAAIASDWCVAQGGALLMQHRATEALALFEPTACANSRDPGEQSALDFEHARAVLAASGDRLRAGSLARQARDALKTDAPLQVSARARIDEWLRNLEREGPSRAQPKPR